MGRFLNVGIIQMPVSTDTADNLQYIEEKAKALMCNYHKPELIVGVESIACFTPEYIPGNITEFFSKIARKHEIYFVPGTISEKSDDLPEGMFYNTAIVFSPKGELIGKYRKMAPWRPAESSSQPGREYLVFDIPEKKTKIGVQICYDLNFPEISRNETLMGAEVLLKLTMDPQEIHIINKYYHNVRALENQAYFVSTNGTGFFLGSHLYGNSMVVSPEGNVIWEAGQEPCIATATLDLDLVTRCRENGTLFMDHYLKHLLEYDFPMPFADDITKAPLFQSLGAAPKDAEEYDKNIKGVFKNYLGKRTLFQPDFEAYALNLREFLEKRK